MHFMFLDFQIVLLFVGAVYSIAAVRLSRLREFTILRRGGVCGFRVLGIWEFWIGRCSSFTFSGIHVFASRLSLWFSGFGNLGILYFPFSRFRIFCFRVFFGFLVSSFKEFGLSHFQVYGDSSFRSSWTCGRSGFLDFGNSGSLFF
jgi:hypothetical protein